MIICSLMPPISLLPRQGYSVGFYCQEITPMTSKGLGRKGFFGERKPLCIPVQLSASRTTVPIAWSSIKSVYNERISNPQTTVPIVSAVTQEVSFTPRQNLIVLTQFSHLSEKEVSFCGTPVSKGCFSPSLKPRASSLLSFTSQHCMPESKLSAQTPLPLSQGLVLFSPRQSSSPSSPQARQEPAELHTNSYFYHLFPEGIFLLELRLKATEGKSGKA